MFFFRTKSQRPRTKNQIANLQLLSHANRSAAFRPNTPLYIVHKIAHEEDTTPGAFKDVFCCGRIWDFCWIEPRALVMDTNLEPVRRVLCSDANDLRLVLLVPVKYGVRHGFPNGHIDAKSDVLGDSRAAQNPGN